MTTARNCDCCGVPERSAMTKLCDRCIDAGCRYVRDSDGDMVRGSRCPLVLAGPDVVACLHCGKPLHFGEALTFIDNANPGAGGCHARCVEAYHAGKARR